ncbi:2'-5' RNA ligase family protein [Dyella ginsengisoli]|uniref:2'-5' RNA ligase family protein n=1 Tax=Dyella ginsengisoli TaxID=363848 RepID=UPI000347AF78|nr:2'-5' RNA ligase family protein [Dyella ginsengisoli]
MPSPQDSLFDTVQAPMPRHRLFFALVPSEAARARLAEVAAALRARHELTGRWVQPARYHLTMAFLGDHVSLGDALLASARCAGEAAATQATPFVWTADRIDSFRGRQPPCVLRGGSEVPALLALRDGLRRELARRALDGQMGRSFVPHVTLAYAERALPAPVMLEGEVEWPVDALELLHGEVGHHAYRTLGHWRLGAS